MGHIAIHMYLHIHISSQFTPLVFIFLQAINSHHQSAQHDLSSSPLTLFCLPSCYIKHKNRKNKKNKMGTMVSVSDLSFSVSHFYSLQLTRDVRCIFILKFKHYISFFTALQQVDITQNYIYCYGATVLTYMYFKCKD